jgi:hypothetical protein
LSAHDRNRRARLSWITSKNYYYSQFQRVEQSSQHTHGDKSSIRQNSRPHFGKRRRLYAVAQGDELVVRRAGVRLSRSRASLLTRDRQVHERDQMQILLACLNSNHKLEGKKRLHLTSCCCCCCCTRIRLRESSRSAHTLDWREQWKLNKFVSCVRSRSFLRLAKDTLAHDKRPNQLLSWARAQGTRATTTTTDVPDGLEPPAPAGGA